MTEYVLGDVPKDTDPVYSPFGWPWYVCKHCCGYICVRAGSLFCLSCYDDACHHMKKVGMKSNPYREWWQFWKPKQVDDMRPVHEGNGWVYGAELSVASARELGVPLESLLRIAGR